MAVKGKMLPRDVNRHVHELQQTLLRDDCYIPGIKNEDEQDLMRDAAVQANAWLPGCEPQNVVNGMARTVGDDLNCWAACTADAPKLTVQWEEPKLVRYIHFAFDSNLSREITISINQEVLGRQSESTPPELVKAFRIVLECEGKTTEEITLEDVSQRKVIVDLKKEIVCDRMLVEQFETHGSEIVRIFEVRAYSSVR